MKTEIVHTEKGDLSYCKMENESIVTSSDFLEVIVNCPTHTIILDKSALNQDFFELKTGVAGEFLQKVSNYQRRLVVLGNCGAWGQIFYLYNSCSFFKQKKVFLLGM